jgi:hypothetical protein
MTLSPIVEFAPFRLEPLLVQFLMTGAVLLLLTQSYYTGTKQAHRI